MPWEYGVEQRHQEESSGRWDNSSVCFSRMPALHQVQGESQIDPAHVDSMSSIGKKKKKKHSYFLNS